MPSSHIGFKINEKWLKVNEVRFKSLIFFIFKIRFHRHLVSVHDDSISMNLSSNSNNHLSSTNDFENVHSDDDVHVHSNQGTQKAFGALADIDCYDLSSSTSLLDPQLAAYRAIMSRMIPFANHMNGNNRSPHRNSTSNANGSSVVKQEAMTNADESSQDNESNVSSPIGEHSTP